MIMPNVFETIEGTWEEISTSASKFTGHRPPVTILPHVENAPAQDRLAQLARYKAWIETQRPKVVPLLDDSRNSFYSDEDGHG